MRRVISQYVDFYFPQWDKDFWISAFEFLKLLIDIYTGEGQELFRPAHLKEMETSIFYQLQIYSCTQAYSTIINLPEKLFQLSCHTCVPSDTSKLLHNFRSLSLQSVLFRFLHNINVCSTLYFLLCCLRTGCCLLPFFTSVICSKPHPFNKLRRDKLIELLILKNREIGIMFLTEEHQQKPSEIVPCTKIWLGFINEY